MEDVQAFLEKRGQNLVFFNEELGASEQNKFHSGSLCLFSVCKGTKKQAKHKKKAEVFFLFP